MLLAGSPGTRLDDGNFEPTDNVLCFVITDNVRITTPMVCHRKLQAAVTTGGLILTPDTYSADFLAKGLGISSPCFRPPLRKAHRSSCCQSKSRGLEPFNYTRFDLDTFEPLTEDPAFPSTAIKCIQGSIKVYLMSMLQAVGRSDLVDPDALVAQATVIKDTLHEPFLGVLDKPTAIAHSEMVDKLLSLNSSTPILNLPAPTSVETIDPLTKKPELLAIPSNTPTSEKDLHPWIELILQLCMVRLVDIVFPAHPIPSPRFRRRMVRTHQHSIRASLSAASAVIFVMKSDHGHFKCPITGVIQSYLVSGSLVVFPSLVQMGSRHPSTWEVVRCVLASLRIQAGSCFQCCEGVEEDGMLNPADSVAKIVGWRVEGVEKEEVQKRFIGDDAIAKMFVVFLGKSLDGKELIEKLVPLVKETRLFEEVLRLVRVLGMIMRVDVREGEPEKAFEMRVEEDGCSEEDVAKVVAEAAVLGSRTGWYENVAKTGALRLCGRDGRMWMMLLFAARKMVRDEFSGDLRVLSGVRHLAEDDAVEVVQMMDKRLLGTVGFAMCMDVDGAGVMATLDLKFTFRQARLATCMREYEKKRLAVSKEYEEILKAMKRMTKAYNRVSDMDLDDETSRKSIKLFSKCQELQTIKKLANGMKKILPDFYV
ncbi:hypothetical protein BC829DRAFT_485979 [Chytridium lagenaria]|nr:hypothetical protein BC829DRAFT_485979 [Chytridium lagenaria]